MGVEESGEEAGAAGLVGGGLWGLAGEVAGVPVDEALPEEGDALEVVVGEGEAVVLAGVVLVLAVVLRAPFGERLRWPDAILEILLEGVEDEE